MLIRMAERLENGQDSIDRNTPYFNEERGVWMLTWRVRDHDGKLHTKRVQGKTKGLARRRAREKCDEILAVGVGGAWKPSDKCEDYIDKVVIPAIQNSGASARTIYDYTRSIKHMRAKTKGMPLSAMRKPKTVIRLYEEVAESNGKEAARQMRSVAQNYMFREMILEGLLDANPTKGLAIPKLAVKRRDKYTPTTEEWWAMLQWVLDDDLEQPMPGKDSPQSKKKSAIARHRRVAELTLLQMATGLRITEALTLRWEHVTIKQDGGVWVTVLPELSKTKKGRTVPVLVPKVAEALKRTRAEKRPGDYVIPQPTSDKPWDRSNASAGIRDYYDGIAKVSDLDFASEISSHAWRRTLNTMTAGYLPAHVRASYFGHTEEMNARAYTDPVKVRPMLDTVHQLIDGMTAEKSTRKSTLEARVLMRTDAYSCVSDNENKQVTASQNLFVPLPTVARTT